MRDNIREINRLSAIIDEQDKKLRKQAEELEQERKRLKKITRAAYKVRARLEVRAEQAEYDLEQERKRGEEAEKDAVKCRGRSRVSLRKLLTMIHERDSSQRMLGKVMTENRENSERADQAESKCKAQAEQIAGLGLAVERLRDEFWEDTRMVKFDGTITMGHGYDFFGWESLRSELHCPYGSWAVWPSSYKWSAYGTREGVLMFEKFDTEMDAKNAVMEEVARVHPEHPSLFQTPDPSALLAEYRREVLREAAKVCEQWQMAEGAKMELERMAQDAGSEGGKWDGHNHKQTGTLG